MEEAPSIDYFSLVEGRTASPRRSISTSRDEAQETRRKLAEDLLNQLYEPMKVRASFRNESVRLIAQYVWHLRCFMTANEAKSVLAYMTDNIDIPLMDLPGFTPSEQPMMIRDQMSAELLGFEPKLHPNAYMPAVEQQNIPEKVQAPRLIPQPEVDVRMKRPLEGMSSLPARKKKAVEKEKEEEVNKAIRNEDVTRKTLRFAGQVIIMKLRDPSLKDQVKTLAQQMIDEAQGIEEAAVQSETDEELTSLMDISFCEGDEGFGKLKKLVKYMDDHRGSNPICLAKFAKLYDNLRLHYSKEWRLPLNSTIFNSQFKEREIVSSFKRNSSLKHRIYRGRLLLTMESIVGKRMWTSDAKLSSIYHATAGDQNEVVAALKAFKDIIETSLNKQ